MSKKKYKIVPVNITKVMYKLLTFIPRNTKFQPLETMRLNWDKKYRRKVASSIEKNSKIASSGHFSFCWVKTIALDHSRPLALKEGW